MGLRLFVLIAVLAGVVYLAFFVPSVTQEEAFPIGAPPKNAADQKEKNASQRNDQNISPIQSALLKDREVILSPLLERKYLSTLFSPLTWAPPVKKAAAPLVAPTPSAPSLPFRFLGKQKIGNEIKVFLAEGEKTWVVSERSKIGNQYMVDSIAPPKMTLVFLPLNTKQEISIGVFSQ
jgi:hypothetical protein